MGNSLGIELVAEGVETLQCAQMMTQLGVGKLQGYYFNKPLPWDQARELC